MASETLAPWAEPAPQQGPMNVDDLLTLPEDGWMYELVEGRLVRMAPSSPVASHLGIRLAAALTAFTDEHGLGIVTGADGEFAFSEDTSLAPDVAFVHAERIPPRTDPHFDKIWRVAPDLAAEIASHNQYRPKMAAKARLYLAAGVRLVWIVWPKRRQVDVWWPGDKQPSRTLGVTDTLDGLDMLPGFSYPLARLFAFA